MQAKALKLRETSSFVVEWLKAPLVTASVIPSSQRLAKKMVVGLDASVEQVIELGPGTGVFTNAILAAGVSEAALVLVELNAKFATQLQHKYPQATVINGSAESLAHFGLGKADRVISGLPLLSIRDVDVDAILGAAFSVMKPGAALVQFTYGYKCPVKPALMLKHGLMARRENFVLNNFPPAYVYHIYKR